VNRELRRIKFSPPNGFGELAGFFHRSEPSHLLTGGGCLCYTVWLFGPSRCHHQFVLRWTPRWRTTF